MHSDQDPGQPQMKLNTSVSKNEARRALTEQLSQRQGPVASREGPRP